MFLIKTLGTPIQIQLLDKKFGKQFMITKK